MVTATILYQGALRTRATHLQSGNSIRTDAPIDNQGKGEDFSPTDLLATSLGACMITIMGIEANKLGLKSADIDNTNIAITKKMSSTLPRCVSQIEISMKIPDKISDEHMTLFRQFAENCPVAKSINPAIDVKFELTCE